jgi:hypothetical protein
MSTTNNTRRLGFFGALGISVLLLLAGATARAQAASVWQIYSTSETTAQPGGQFVFYVEVFNTGDVSTDGTEFKVTATLPDGMTGASADGMDCSGLPGATVIDCTTTASVPAHDTRMLVLTADVDGGAPLGVGTARFDISGGGTPSDSTADPVLVTPTPPTFGIDAFDASVDGDATGAPFTQAGGHPYSYTNSFDVTTATDPSPFVGPLRPLEPLKDVHVDLPPGFIGNPTGAAKCTIPDLANTPAAAVAAPLCPPSSQVGTALIRQSGQGGASNFIGPVPLFNVVPPPEAPARFGFNAFGTVVVIDAHLRSDSDYGVTAVVENASEGLALIGTTVTLWGVPSDPSHDAERACPGLSAPANGGQTCKSGSPPTVFLRNPTSCTDPGVGLPTTLRLDSWANPGVFHEATSVSHLPPGYPFAPIDWGPEKGPDGCENVPFDPKLEGQPLTGSKASQPAGFAFDLTLPQNDSFNSIAQSDLKKAVVTLPEGVRVNPSSADGLQGCSSAQIGLVGTGFPAPNPIHFDKADPSCPDASKIGEVTVTTPDLEDPLKGALYLATPYDNPFGSLISLYIVVKGSGVIAKLPGEVSLDPNTGQITTIFDNSPQVPLSSLHLELKSGPRAPLTLPNTCGKYTTHSVMTGWNAKTGNSDSSFSVDQGCGGGGFSPILHAGVDNPLAGQTSPFSLQLKRSDSDQEFSSLTATLPPGLTGYLKGIPACPQAAIDAARSASGFAELASPSCPAASQVGTVVAGAGAGTNPFYVDTGRAYLAGPYKGAPLSVVFLTPAVAGPFDLGDVVVQAALRIDPTTAQISAVSDPLPSVLQGIPLNVRDLRVNMNRDHFTLNPTSCNPMSIDATVQSTQGATANPSDRFQVGECGVLGFKPKLALRLKGGTKRNGHPAFTSVLTARGGDANLARAQVTLPATMQLDQSHIKAPCTRTQFAANQCPPASVIGQATAISPLLDQPLSGPVYLRTGSNPLPDVVLALHGPDSQPVEIDAVGKVDAVNGRLRTTFSTVPDAPLSKAVISLQGAGKGLLVNNTNLCAQTNRATVFLDGQNGKASDSSPTVAVAGCKAHKHHKKHKRHH